MREKSHGPDATVNASSKSAKAKYIFPINCGSMRGAAKTAVAKY